MGNGQELLCYVQTDAGRQLIETLKVEHVALQGRIIGAIQSGVVLVIFGLGMVGVGSRIPDEHGAQGFLVFGLLVIALSCRAWLRTIFRSLFRLLTGASNHGR